MSPVTTDPPEVDTRDFQTWLEDYVNDAEAVVAHTEAAPNHNDATGISRGIAQLRVTVAREILERYRQEQEDQRS